MTRPRFAALCAAILTALTCLQATAQDAPFIGVVTESKVEVRSGAGRAYYVVGELKAGDMARVEKVLFNQTWYQVRVPDTIYSYVSKAFVDARGDGQTGKINADRTEFKAASLRGPGESYRVQGTLSQGDTVKIIGEEGNFYKIASPDDAFVFIPAGTLRQATAADLEAAGNNDSEPDTNGAATPDEPETTEPVTPVPPVTGTEEQANDSTETPATTTDNATDTEPMPDSTDATPVAPVPDDAGTDAADEVDTAEPQGTTDAAADNTAPAPSTDGWPAAPDVKVETPARSDALKALEMKVLPYFSLPLEDQPLDAIAKAYRDLRGTEGLPSIDQQIIAVRLRTIEARLNVLASLAQADRALNTDHARTVVPEPVDPDSLPKRYLAVGILKPSGTYNGQSLPLLYRIVDAAPSGRTLAYVAPSKELSLGAMLNQLIGVTGETTYDRTLKLQVIEIKRAVLLEAEQPVQESSEESAEEAAE